MASPMDATNAAAISRLPENAGRAGRPGRSMRDGGDADVARGHGLLMPSCARQAP
ncbi:hypothetical protein HMPREF0321_1015 [Dermacoccus sp. Ellin185]|nr:hypothetical protein HMPREF0321_1015 [Dermacoccus sp. Ellin185]